MAATPGTGAQLGGTGLGILDLAERLRLPPVALGVLSTALVFGSGLLLATFSRWLPDDSILSTEFWAHPRGWFDLLMAVTIGYAVTSLAWSVRGALRDWEELAHVLDVSPAGRSWLRSELVRFGGHGKYVLDVIAIVAGVAVNFTPGNWPEGRPPLTDAFFVWIMLRTAILFWIVARTVYTGLVLAGRFSRLGSRIAQVDLLELGPLAVFGRHGLRSVLLLMGFSVLFALMALAPFGRDASGSAIVATIVLGTLAFLAPVRGAHRRLRSARDAELVRVRSSIRERTAGSGGEPVTPGSGLADLLAWEARLERAATWPFDAGTMLRFAFFVAVGVGSWLGGAVVERALGAALD
jgi:hypothetical protein